MQDPFSRYERQARLPQIGQEGQRKISASSVAVVGMGALGSVSANLLARAGVGRLRLIDRDFLELQNLQRQALYDEEDVRQNLPKAVAAQRKLQKINSEIEIEAKPSDLNPSTIAELLEEIHLIIDGTDNFETRFLLNDFSLKYKIPWIYGAAVGTEGLAYGVLPGEGPCLRCLFEESPQPGEFQTCDTAGILAPVAHWVASFQAVEALKILAGRRESVERRLMKFDLWKNEFRPIDVGAARRARPDSGQPQGVALHSVQSSAGLSLRCETENKGKTPRSFSASGCSGCTQGEYPYLRRDRGTRTVTLCGRNAVQIFLAERSTVNFSDLAQRLSTLGRVQYNEYLLRASIEPFQITVFTNGRAIIQGTEDAGQAKSVYAKYIGG